MRASIAFSEADSEPTSVFSGALGTRWLRSPAAIFAAVFSMRLSGASVACTTIVPITPPSSTMAMPSIVQYRVSVSAVSMTSLSDRPMNA